METYPLFLISPIFNSPLIVYPALLMLIVGFVLFILYWRKLHNPPGKVLQLIRILVENWHLIVGQLLLYYLLAYSAPGKDITHAFVETLKFNYSFSSAMIVGLGISVLNLGMANSQMPWHLLSTKTRQEYLTEKLRLMIYRFLGLSVFFLIALVFVSQAPEKESYFGEVELFTILLMVGIFAFITVMDSRLDWEMSGKKNPRLTLSKAVFFIILLGTLIVLICAIFQSSETLIGLFMFFLGLSYWSFSKHFDLVYRMRHKVKWLNISKWIYRSISILFLLSFVFFTFAPNLTPVSPIFPLIWGIGFYIHLYDYLQFQYLKDDHKQEWWLAVQKHCREMASKNGGKAKFFFKFFVIFFSSESRKLLFIAFGILFALVLCNPKAGKACVRLVDEDGFDAQKRESLGAYLNNWMKYRGLDTVKGDTTVYPVFIVAGQGGGSRAGYWALATLLQLDSISNGKFRAHCLAISTASGSGPGTVAALAAWDSLASGSIFPNSTCFARRVYNKNYLTSGIAGNFYGDMLRKLLPGKNDWVMDRNYRLQLEEAYCINKAYSKKKDPLCKDSSENLGEHIASIFGDRGDPNHLADRSFYKVYRDNKNGQRYDLPLFFPNSTQVNNGKRAIINPVINVSKPGLFTDAVDLVKQIDSLLKSKQTLTIGQAALLGELFPYVSATGHIDTVGDFVDGGYYENYGLTTAYELLEACETLQIRNQLSKNLKFYIIAAINDDSPENKNKKKPADQQERTVTPSQLIAPLITNFQTPFGGHSEHIRKKVKKEIGGRYIEFVFEKEGVPLSRILSKSALDSLQSSFPKAIDSKAQVLMKELH